ncbi:MAG: NAD-dependent epimerase/dehydratase family protein [Gemmatimonadota bacterium]|nr:NAD-dependent epimerase/dehydratase family protein [Gemmatimonadota bacterium]
MNTSRTTSRSIFLTGGTGYIGSAVARGLAAAGHHIRALAHHQGAVEAFEKQGWEPVRGGLRDLDILASAAREAEAVVHAANTGDEKAAEVDDAAARMFLDALDGSDRVFIYTSGVWVLGPGTADERSEPDPIALATWRAPLEHEILQAKDRGVHTVVLRPGVVWDGGGGLPGMLGREELPVVGDGTQRWPLVHLDDLTDLYLRALDAPAGSILHGITDTATMNEIAAWARVEAGRAGPAPSVGMEEARSTLGAFSEALALDQVVDAEATRRLTGWAPRHTFPAP